MQKPTKLILLALITPLFSCASAPSDADVSKNQEISENGSLAESSAVVSSDGGEILPSSSSSGSESISSKTLTAGWTLGSGAIEKNANYLYDYSFSITNTAGENVRFHGDTLKRGAGEYEGMIQMKKEAGYLECLNPHTGTVTLNVYKRLVSYTSEGKDVNADYTGVPLFYTSDDCVTWAPLSETSLNDDANLTRVYTYRITDAYFKFSPSASNALYLYSVTFGK